MVTNPTGRRWTDQFMIFNLIFALALGICFGYLLPKGNRDSNSATAELAVALSKPLSLNVTVNGSISQTRVNPLLDAVADVAADAIRATGGAVTDKAKLASEATNKFVSELSGGLGGELGKKLVDGFSELISSGFNPSKDKAKDRQVITNVLVGNFLPAGDSSNVVPQLSPRMEVRVEFDINSVRLTPAANEAIGAVRDFALRHPSTIILLTANADTLGSEPKNRELSEMRSKAVLKRLVSAGGIALNRVFVANMGNTALPLVTPTNTAEEQNRSVSIDVRE